MGYANDAVLNGKAKSVCSQFIKIGTDGTTMTLADLIPGGGWKYTDNVKILGDFGEVKVKAYYITAAEIAALPLPRKAVYPTTPGWYVYDTTNLKVSAGEEPLPFGTALLASTGSADAYITSSGEVLQSESGKITFEVKSGKALFVGNCTPINRKLKDFEVGGGWKYTDNIKILGDFGEVKVKAYYISAAEIAALPLPRKAVYPTTPGWYVYDTTNLKVSAGEEDIPAGTGFIASTAADASVSLPSAL